MKDKMRTEMKKKLRGITATVYLPVGIQNKLPFMFGDIQTIFTYIPFDHEIDPTILITHALELKKTVAAPRIVGEDMNFHRLESINDRFKIDSFGISEPLESAPQLFPSSGNQLLFPILILIPGLAFTRKGGRLGRGKGYYDRFLSTFLESFPDKRESIILAGVCHSLQIVDSIPLDKHDILLDCLLSEKGCILCS